MAEPKQMTKEDSKKLQAQLQEAASNADWALVRQMVEANPKLATAPMADGKTLLMLACQNSGNQDLVALLIADKTDVNAKDSYGRTALMHAAASGDIEIVRALVNAGAKVNEKDKKGRGALDYASESTQVKTNPDGSKTETPIYQDIIDYLKGNLSAVPKKI